MNPHQHKYAVTAFRLRSESESVSVWGEQGDVKADEASKEKHWSTFSAVLYSPQKIQCRRLDEYHGCELLCFCQSLSIALSRIIIYSTVRTPVHSASSTPISTNFPWFSICVLLKHMSTGGSEGQRVSYNQHLLVVERVTAKECRLYHLGNMNNTADFIANMAVFVDFLRWTGSLIIQKKNSHLCFLQQWLWTESHNSNAVTYSADTQVRYIQCTRRCISSVTNLIFTLTRAVMTFVCLLPAIV